MSLVDEAGSVLSTGCNGPARGELHCIEVPCGGAKLPSGQGLDSCEAVHAEQNAIMQCRDVMKIRTCYCTTAPCVHCIKLLMNTSCQRVVFMDDYPHSEKSRELWEKVNSGRFWDKYEPSEARATLIVKSTRELLDLALG